MRELNENDYGGANNGPSSRGIAHSWSSGRSVGFSKSLTMSTAEDEAWIERMKDKFFNGPSFLDGEGI